MESPAEIELVCFLILFVMVGLALLCLAGSVLPVEALGFLKLAWLGGARPTDSLVHNTENSNGIEVPLHE